MSGSRDGNDDPISSDSSDEEVAYHMEWPRDIAARIADGLLSTAATFELEDLVACLKSCVYLAVYPARYALVCCGSLGYPLRNIQHTTSLLRNREFDPDRHEANRFCTEYLVACFSQLFQDEMYTAYHKPDSKLVYEAAMLLVHLTVLHQDQFCAVQQLDKSGHHTMRMHDAAYCCLSALSMVFDKASSMYQWTSDPELPAIIESCTQSIGQLHSVCTQICNSGMATDVTASTWHECFVACYMELGGLGYCQQVCVVGTCKGTTAEHQH